MQTVCVQAQNGNYEIKIGAGALRSDALSQYDKVVFITDETVHGHYGAYFDQGEFIILPPGETSKSMEQLQRIYDRLMQSGISRKDAVVALGGGVIGDIAGFAAATFKRGVQFVQIPTTLLAQVDSSVGGKVAVNLPAGKNMVGAFYQPSLVLADTDTLKTLNKKEIAAGMAEVIKYGYIADAELAALLRAGQFTMENVVARCCAIKARYVQEDPFDLGVRMQLNYGHTIGHAIEQAAGYGTYLHGEAVAIGMVLAAWMGEKIGISPRGLREDTEQMLRANHLPVSVERGLLNQALEILDYDKKAEHGRIQFILIERIGKAVIEKLRTEEICKLLKEFE